MAIAEKLQNIINEKSQQATMTNYGLTSGNQITSSTKFIDYPKYIFNAFLEALRTPDTLFTNLPKKSGTGANITLNDTANAPMRIELGASELTQDGTPTPSSPQDIHTISGSNTIKVNGKNLFDSTPLHTLVAQGVSITWYDDNTVELNGSFTGSSNIGVNQDMTNKIKANGIMSISVISGSMTGEMRFNLFDSNSSWYNRWVSLTNTSNASFTDSYTFNKCNIGVFVGASFNHLRIGLQVEKGSTATTYTPYISQEADIDLGTNMFNKYTIFDGDIRNGNFKIRLCSRQDLYLKAGTYTFSTNMPTTYKWLIQTQSVGVPPLDAYPTYDFEYGWTTDASKTFTLTNDGYFDLQIQKGSNQNLKVADIIDYDFQLVKGSEVLPFKEYREPIEYCKIGNYEDKFIRTSGKNLFDGEIELGSINIDTGENTSSTTRTRSKNYIKVKPNTTYYISFGGTTGYRWVVGYKANKSVITDGTINQEHPSALYQSANNGTFTTTATTEYIRWYDTGNTNVNDLVMIAQSSVAVDYEPYGSNEWYIKKNIGKVVLDGTEVWNYNDGNSLFYLSDFINYIFSTFTPMSNYYQGQPSVSGYGNVNNKRITTLNLSGNSRLILKDTDFADTTALTTWLSTHNTIVYYVLATPTYTQITGTLAEQLENVYKKLLSYDNQTNISQINNDLSFVLNVQAIEG